MVVTCVANEEKTTPGSSLLLQGHMQAALDIDTAFCSMVARRNGNSNSVGLSKLAASRCWKEYSQFA